MGRHYVGPRKLDKSGNYYAAYTCPETRRRRSKSLGKDKTKALMLWPAAIEQLKKGVVIRSIGDSVSYARENLGNLKYLADIHGVEYVTLDLTGGSQDPVSGELDPLSDSIACAIAGLKPLPLSWDEAIQMYKERFREKKGKPISASSEAALKAGLMAIGDITIENLTPNEIRLMIKRLKDKSLSPSTIQQRCSLLSSVIEVVLKSGIEVGISENPFGRVDYQSTSNNHYRTPDSNDYAMLASLLPALKPNVRFVLEVLAFTGLRIGELLSRKPEDLEGQWLQIREREGWRPKTITSIRQVPLPLHLAEMGLPQKWPSLASISKATKQVNAQLTNHSWRHGFKTMGRLGQADEVAIEVLMGHGVGSQIQRTYGVWPKEPLLIAANKSWKALQSVMLGNAI